jgi:methanogenic corrinoid protein MtbC1
MGNEKAWLLEEIRSAFAAGDEERGYELMTEAIERHEMPSDVVARALSAGLAAWGSAPVGSR